MTRSSRALPVLLAALALAGCSYSINGAAVPQPAFTAAAPISTSSSSASSSNGAAPKIAKPRTVAGVDPCKMLDEADLKPIGPYKKPPTRQDDVIQESCAYVLEDGTPTSRTVVSALYQKFETVRDRQKGGQEQLVEGHSAWMYCQLSGPEQICAATIAVNANRSILVAMAQAGGVPDQMLAAMAPLFKAALARIPAAP